MADGVLGFTLSSNKNEAEQEETETPSEETEDDGLCECEKRQPLEEPEDKFNEFENNIVSILKRKVPEFSDDYEESTENVTWIREALKDAVNTIDSDIFIIGYRECEKQHKIPVYDDRELRECYAYFVASEKKIAKFAIIQPVGGAQKRIKAGSLEIAPLTTTNNQLEDNIYRQRYKNIIDRRKKVCKYKYFSLCPRPAIKKY